MLAQAVFFDSELLRRIASRELRLWFSLKQLCRWTYNVLQPLEEEFLESQIVERETTAYVQHSFRRIHQFLVDHGIGSSSNWKWLEYQGWTSSTGIQRGKLTTRLLRGTNLLHAVGKPALIVENGLPAMPGRFEVWAQRGVPHREDGPAILMLGQGKHLLAEAWLQYGFLHRQVGPALILYFSYMSGNNYLLRYRPPADRAPIVREFYQEGKRTCYEDCEAKLTLFIN